MHGRGFWNQRRTWTATGRGARLRAAVLAVAVGLLLGGVCTVAGAGEGRAGAGGDPPPLFERQARAVIETAGTAGGLVVHLGAGDGPLTAALHRGPAYLVHGLTRDAGAVGRARERIHRLGLYGRVSVEHWTGSRLPYADNLVNLVVAEDLGEVPMDEVMRVLVPGGAACLRQGDRWTKTVKPRPEEIDEWTHFLRGPDNNAVARDRRVGPPQRLQWWAGPRWCRSHEFISSLAAMVGGGGRLFYVFDEGLTGVTDPRLPERWVLVGRDAFNGVRLWKRPVPDWRAGMRWGTALRGRPGSVPRRLVADGDRLYATLSREGGVEVIEAATGKTLRTFEGTETAEELVLIGRTLLVHLAGAGETRKTPPERILAIHPDTGEVRWRADLRRYQPQSLAADAGRVIYSTGQETVCLGLADGKEHWRVESKGKPRTWVIHGDVVVESTGKALLARDAKTGKPIWTTRTGGASMRPEDVFIVRGRVWQAVDGNIVGYDLATGEAGPAVDPSPVQTPGHHLRCYRAKATERYIITQWRGVEFVSITGQPHAQADWARGACRYGVMPANGLLYVPPHPCFCYPGAKLTGFNALAPAAEEGSPGTEPAGERLRKGPASTQIGNRKSETGQGASGMSDRESQISEADWPTYRHDPRRSGAAGCEVPPTVQAAWRANLGGALTPPVLAAGRLYVAAKDEQTLYALDAETGGRLWRFTAGGRIDSPPTVHGGRVLFGAADGCVYALRASDGVLAWRFRAAPRERRIMSGSRLESAWPVHGSVLVENGLVYATAGRSTFLDGGIRLVALDPATGEVRHRARVDTWSRTREDTKGEPVVPAYYMEGARSDILVAQGGHLFLGQYKFDRRLARQDVPYLLPAPDEPADVIRVKGKPYTMPNANPKADYEDHQRKWLERTQRAFVANLRQRYGGWTLGYRRMGLHLLAPFGFLDDSWFNRTFWMYSETWPGYYHTHRAAKTGQLLVVGPERTYAVQAYPSRNLQSPLFTPGEKGYLLYADAEETDPVLGPETRGTTKGWGFTRDAPPVWYDWVPIRMRAMVLAGKHLFVAGPPDVVPDDDPMAAFEGRKGAALRAVSAADGKTLAEQHLDAPPVFDGLIAAGGRLYMVTTDGSVRCFGQADAE